MTLLCISILALLLLPLSLSCDGKRTPEEVRHDYTVVVQTDLNNTDSVIAGLLQNSTCRTLKQKLHTCKSGKKDIVSTLHSLTCKMKNLSVTQTDDLVSSVLSSLRCPCKENPTKVTGTTRRRRSEQMEKQKIRKLCQAKAILSEMTTCYQMLNTIQMDTPNSSSSQS